METDINNGLVEEFHKLHTALTDLGAQHLRLTLLHKRMRAFAYSQGIINIILVAYILYWR